MDTRLHRLALGISQARLARLAGVSRFRLNQAELGAARLSDEERARIADALHAEAARLRRVVEQIEHGAMTAGAGG